MKNTSGHWQETAVVLAACPSLETTSLRWRVWKENWKRKRTANVGRQWHSAVGVVAVGRRGPGDRRAGGSNRATETAPMRCGGGNNAKETAPTRR